MPQSPFTISSRLAAAMAAVALAAGLSVPAGPVAGQEVVSTDLFGGVTAPVGGLADVTTGPAWHAGAGLGVPVSAGWGLRVEAGLHEFTERRLGSTAQGREAPDRHLQLWQFFVLAERGLVADGRLRVRARGGPGLTRTGSDHMIPSTRGGDLSSSDRRFSHSVPAFRVDLDAGYRIGPGDVFLRAGTVVTALPGDETFFYRRLSGDEVGDMNTLISLPVSAGVRVTF